MRHAKRIGAAAIASSLSLLTTLGVAEAIDASDGSADAPAPAANERARTTAAPRTKGPSRLIVIRRTKPAAGSSGGTVYVQAPTTTTVTAPAPAPAAPAPAPAAPVTSSS
jgi:hypothetical protein